MYAGCCRRMLRRGRGTCGRGGNGLRPSFLLLWVILPGEGRGAVRIYLDLAMLLNFLVDGLLLLGTNRLAGHPPNWQRCGLAATVGAMYAGICLVPGFRFLGSALWRLVFLGIMGVLAFGPDKSGRKRCGLFVILSMALGGLASGMGRPGAPVLLLCCGGLWLLCGIGFSGPVGREYLPLEIRHLERVVSLTALRDTGNALRDPITGEPVLVIGADAARRLTGLTAAELRAPLETLGRGKTPGLRLVPYRAVGQPAGMLLAMRFENVKLGKRQGPALVAFAPDRIGGSDGYQALTGGVL